MMTQRATRILTLAIFLLAIGALSPASAADGIARFYGSYVGSGTAERSDDKAVEQRDLDVTIRPFKDNGFSLKWITVMRAPDGERASEGVKRREIDETFIPYKDRAGVYIDAPSGGLFAKAELPNPLKGEPMRWAAIDGDTLTVYSMAITDTGAAELQIFHRTLTEKGMKVTFLRMHDEQVLVRLSGDLIKAN
jgi:hypothetical protein